MDNRFARFQEVIEAFDEGYELSFKYDSMTHQYGDEILYQAEMHFIQAIGQSSNITVTTIANQTGKTMSACSQMAHKLQKRGLVSQNRNSKNNREYYLSLTEHGQEIYNVHEKFDASCLARTCADLAEFSDRDLQTYAAIQKKLNQAFKKDIEENGALF